MTKRGLVVLLVALNLVLAATLILMAGRPNAAMAQAAPLGSNFVVVSGAVQRNLDALYVLDLANRDLHCFIVDRTTHRITHRDRRDMLQDFRGGR